MIPVARGSVGNADVPKFCHNLAALAISGGVSTTFAQIFRHLSYRMHYTVACLRWHAECLSYFRAVFASCAVTLPGASQAPVTQPVTFYLSVLTVGAVRRFHTPLGLLASSSLLKLPPGLYAEILFNAPS